MNTFHARNTGIGATNMWSGTRTVFPEQSHGEFVRIPQGTLEGVSPGSVIRYRQHLPDQTVTYIYCEVTNITASGLSLSKRDGSFQDGLFTPSDTPNIVNHDCLQAHRQLYIYTGEVSVSESQDSTSTTNEHTFSEDPVIATVELINILKSSGFTWSAHNWTSGISFYKVMGIDRKQIVIEKHGRKFGLISTVGVTDHSIHTQDWDNFGRSASGRKQFNYTGKSISEVVSLICDIIY